MSLEPIKQYPFFRTGMNTNPLYLPETKSITELFTNIHPHNVSIPWSLGVNKKYLYISGREEECSFVVDPSEKVIEIVRKAQANVYDDHIYFEVIIRENNLLVTAQYNSIIGNRWLCLLPKDKLNYFC